MNIVHNFFKLKPIGKTIFDQKFQFFLKINYLMSLLFDFNVFFITLDRITLL